MAFQTAQTMIVDGGIVWRGHHVDKGCAIWILEQHDKVPIAIVIAPQCDSPHIAGPKHGAATRLEQLDPAGTMVGPLVARTVYGDISWDDHPVSMHRIYKVEKAKLQDALSILPNIEKLSNDTSGVMAIVPTFGPDMDRLTVVYQFTSITAAGEQIDRIGMSEEFQKLVIKAHDAGTLVSSRMLVAI